MIYQITGEAPKPAEYMLVDPEIVDLPIFFSLAEMNQRLPSGPVMIPLFWFVAPEAST